MLRLSHLLLALLTSAVAFITSVRAQGSAPLSPLYYEEYGQGEPVLLIHGHTLDRRMWQREVNLLKGRYRVIVPDLRGYGLSPDPVEGRQFTYADDMIALLDGLHIDRVHVVGLSMGAYVAGDMLAIYPERLLSCMMVAGEISTSPGPSTPKSSAENARRRQEAAALLRRGLEPYKRKRIEALIERGGSRAEEMRDLVTQMVMDWGCWQSLHVTARVYYGQDAFAKLRVRRPDVRSIIIYGDKEKKPQSRMLKYLPNASQITVEDCGHMVNLEQPEMFDRILLEWLDKGGLHN